MPGDQRTDGAMLIRTQPCQPQQAAEHTRHIRQHADRFASETAEADAFKRAHLPVLAAPA